MSAESGQFRPNMGIRGQLRLDRDLIWSATGENLSRIRSGLLDVTWCQLLIKSFSELSRKGWNAYSASGAPYEYEIEREAVLVLISAV